MKAVNGKAIALDRAEEMFGVHALSDRELMSTEGGMTWLAVLGVGGGAVLAGVAVGVILYCVLH